MHPTSIRSAASLPWTPVLGLLLSLPAGIQGLDAGGSVSVTTVLQATASWDGTPIAYPVGTPEVTGQIVEIAPGGETGWHLHPVPSFGLVLAGELQVTLQDGRTRTLKAGEALSEVVGTFHCGRNLGPVPVRLVVFYAGVVGQKNAMKAPAVPVP